MANQLIESFNKFTIVLIEFQISVLILNELFVKLFEILMQLIESNTTLKLWQILAVIQSTPQIIKRYLMPRPELNSITDCNTL